jgi:double-stranded RNA-specific adenosine deaminase
MSSLSGATAPNSSHKNVRHAEKRRTATCAFADRIAQLSVDHYKARLGDRASPLTCVSAMVAHVSETDSLRVISMGVGTKFLKFTELKDDHPYGSRLRDMHAEILCQRAFKRYLMLEMRQHLLYPHDDHKSYILRSTQSVGTKTQFALKPGVTLHFYCSSVPCGNASWKKFVKLQKEVFMEDLADDQWPTTSHTPNDFGSSLQLGEFALLLKKDIGYIAKGSEVNNGNHGHANGKRPRYNNDNIQPSATSNTPKPNPWPCQLTDDWCPPGTVPAIQINNTTSTIHTCSDKLCRWNVLGCQGTLLAALLKDPLYMATLTVGRKFSNATCRRAVCCRLQDKATKKRSNQFGKQRPLSFQQKLNQAVQNKTSQARLMGETRENSATAVMPSTTAKCALLPSIPPNNYRIHHPTVMGTAVHLDDTAVVETSSTQHGQDVRFHSPHVWAWWANECDVEMVRNHGSGGDGTAATSHANGGILECVDGTTGYLTTNDGSVVAADPTFISAISTQALTGLFTEVQSLVAGDDEKQGNASVRPRSISTLSDLVQLKEIAAPAHELAKNFVLEHHRVMKDWKRRRNC